MPTGSLPPELAAALDVAVLAPGTRREDVIAACRGARELGCAAVCVSPLWVADAVRELDGSAVAVCGVVGFPLGATTTLTKVFEALECIKQGATELDIVIPVGAARAGDFKAVRREAQEIVRRTPEAIHKLILEWPLLTDDQRRRAVKAVMAASPAFLKTGTGTVGEPVSPADVQALRSLAPGGVRIKAAGGIRTREHAEALLRAGAQRLGTSTPYLPPGSDL